MKTQNLATTLAAALTRIPDNTPPKPMLAADPLLLRALRNSATRRDQIVQRRIGIYPARDRRHLVTILCERESPPEGATRTASATRNG